MKLYILPLKDYIWYGQISAPNFNQFFKNESYTNQIFINYCTEYVCHVDLVFSHRYLFTVYLRRHRNDQIPVILQTNENIVIFSL